MVNGPSAVMSPRTAISIGCRWVPVSGDVAVWTRSDMAVKGEPSADGPAQAAGRSGRRSVARRQQSFPARAGAWGDPMHREIHHPEPMNGVEAQAAGVGE